METNLAFSIGKTFGQIDNGMKKIDNMNFKEKRELEKLFYNLLADIKKFYPNYSIEEIEQKVGNLSKLSNIEESKILANEIYKSIREFMQNVYFKLKYNVD